VPRVPSNLHPSPACRKTHAITYVSLCSTGAGLPLHHLRLRSRSPMLTPSPDTGDRPYKCQYCGDQFARRCGFHPSAQSLHSSSSPSDLLSRHVNKCHANEKPTPNAAGGRRKGSAAASRATTSKQACDQCVQSSLPCDGSNPCCARLISIAFE